MLNGRKLVTAGGVQGGGCGRFIICMLLLISSYAYGQLGPQDVVILVNQNSPTSRYIAKLYRQYHPEISESQVLYLSGLADCSGPQSTPANEIITRQEYNTLIAEPVRNYLADPGHPERITTIKIIITTAGMPYRIEDTNYGDAIYPSGSNPSVVSGHTSAINAASVESELVGLWYGDYGSNPFGLSNRLVNPYQGYHYSSFDLFERVVPGTKNMVWSVPASFGGPPAKLEGELGPFGFGTINRNFNAGDMYLTCRLDGAKKQGQSAVFAVRAMLERAKRASSTSYGINPLQAVAVFDDVPSGSDLDNNRVFSLNSSANYWVYELNVPQPPDAPYPLMKDDYVAGFTAMTDKPVNYNNINTGLMDSAYDLCVILDRRSGTRTNQADLDSLLNTYPERQEGQGAILVATFGRNGDEGSASNYILKGGPGGGALFNLVNGAVFTSLESLNAVTMFSDCNTLPVAQGKLVDFIEIGGAGAIGHSFEPLSTAVIDNLYLFYNLLADDDGDGKADLTFVEAAFTAMPFLSWSEVVIGDPLMRIAYGPGGLAWKPRQGDANLDGLVNFKDVRLLNPALGGQLNSPDPAIFGLYNDLCDFNQDGIINFKDVRIL
ncbi:MAG: hypothetical protein MUP16_04575, partial [Sedimentisphaerales bacterium]|nr:hypothetical protein [Sedimentisphaerales bacterium]